MPLTGPQLAHARPGRLRTPGVNELARFRESFGDFALGDVERASAGHAKIGAFILAAHFIDPSRGSRRGKAMPRQLGTNSSPPSFRRTAARAKSCTDPTAAPWRTGTRSRGFAWSTASTTATGTGRSRKVTACCTSSRSSRTSRRPGRRGLSPVMDGAKGGGLAQGTRPLADTDSGHGSRPSSCRGRCPGARAPRALAA